MTSEIADHRPVLTPEVDGPAASAPPAPVSVGLRAHWIREVHGSVAQCDWERRIANFAEGTIIGTKSAGRPQFQPLSINSDRVKELKEFLSGHDSAADEAAELLAGRICEALPVAAVKQLRGQTAPEGAAGSEIWLEVYLPLLERNRTTDFAASLRNCVADVDDDGAIRVRPANQSLADYRTLYHTTIGLAAALCPPSGDSQDCPIVWSDQRPVRPEQWGLLMKPLLEDYGLEGVQPVSGPAVARWSIELNATAARPWLDTPNERTTAHQELFQAVSRATQQCLRRWLPYVGFSSPNTFRTRDLVYALAVYGTGRPFSKRGQRELTYDLLSRESIEAASDTASHKLTDRLINIRQYLTQTGRDVEAGWYQPKPAHKAIAKVPRGNKWFLRLLAADRTAVERFLRWADEFTRRKELLNSPEDAARHLPRTAEALDRPFRKFFRRLLSAEDLSTLGPLLQIDATVALRRAMKLQAEARVTLEIEEEGGEVRRISSVIA